MNRPYIFGGLLFFLLGIFFCQAAAQKNQSIRSIQNDFKQQKISRAQKVLYQLYAGFRPGRLPAAYRANNPGADAIKCATPFIMDYYQHRGAFGTAVSRKVDAMIGPPILQAQHQYNSASGRFTIFYGTSGADAVPAGDGNANAIPDYVEWAAAAADSSWRHEVQRLGFSNPIVGSTNPYPIFIEDLGATGFYGLTSPGTNRGFTNSTYIVINSQLDQPAFTKNDDPNHPRGAVDVTIAHEFKHAIQYANSRWYTIPDSNNGPHSLDWTEMDATLMEEIVYDNVNDYYNYLTSTSSVFLDDEHTVPASYPAVTWMIYFAEDFEPAFWVRVWQQIHQRFVAEQPSPNPDYLTMPQAIRAALAGSYDDTFSEAFIQSHLWHFASGPANSAPDFGFGERENYPAPTINFNLMGKDSITTQQTIPALSAHYIRVDATAPIPGSVVVELDSTRAATGLGVLAYFNDGSTDFQTYSSTSEGALTAKTPWKWNDIQSLGMVVSNSNTGTAAHYTLHLQSDVPPKITLDQNYPNPFSRTTTIPLAIPEDAHLKVTVFDIAGRKVQTLIDEDRSAGANPIQFDGSRLASGIYFVQVLVDGKVFVKKMTLIK